MLRHVAELVRSGLSARDNAGGTQTPDQRAEAVVRAPKAEEPEAPALGHVGEGLHLAAEIAVRVPPGSQLGQLGRPKLVLLHHVIPDLVLAIHLRLQGARLAGIWPGLNPE